MRPGTPSARIGPVQPSQSATLASPETQPVKHKDAAVAADTSPPDVAEPERVLLHMPVDVRNLALVVVAVIASAFALQWAKAVFIPLLLGVMFSYALTPLVDRLERWRLPRAAGAGLLLATIVFGLGWGAWSISDDANALIETLPEVAQKLRRSMQKPGPNSGSTIEKVQQAAAEIEQATEESATPASNSAASGNAASATRSAATSAPGGGSARPASAQCLRRRPLRVRSNRCRRRCHRRRAA